MMTKYLINPSVFYWINVLGILQTVFAIFGSILVAACIGFVCGYFYHHKEYKIYERDDNKPYIIICKRWAIVTGLIGIFLICLSIFLPGKSTSIEMLIAKTATFDNMEWSVQQIKELVDYIVTAIKTI